MAKATKDKIVAPVPDLSIPDNKQFVDNLCLVLEGECQLQFLLNAYSMNEATLKVFMSHENVRREVAKRRYEMNRDGTLIKVANLNALNKNRGKTSEFLGADLSANAHKNISDLAYKLSGLEVKDKRAEAPNPADDFRLTINLTGASVSPEAIAYARSRKSDSSSLLTVIRPQNIEELNELNLHENGEEVTHEP